MYKPNHIPANERVVNIVVALALLCYGAYGLWVDDLLLPMKRSSVHLHGLAAFLMFGAFACGALVMIATVVDHYDKRDNEINYRKFARVTGRFGWTFFFLSLAYGFWLDVARGAN